MALMSPITLRLAGPEDDPAIKRLAQLDSAAVPAGPHLVAERQGRIDAALSLPTGAVIADPFRRTAELCELLRRHSDGLRTTAPSSPPRVLQPRAAPVTS
jgi:hypothetical protein